MYVLVDARQRVFGGLDVEAEERFSNRDDCIVHIKMYAIQEEAEEHRSYLKTETTVETLESWLRLNTQVPLELQIEMEFFRNIAKNNDGKPMFTNINEDLAPIWFNLIFDSVLDTATAFGIDTEDVPVGGMYLTHNTPKKIIAYFVEAINNKEKSNETR